MRDKAPFGQGGTRRKFAIPRRKWYYVHDGVLLRTTLAYGTYSILLLDTRPLRITGQRSRADRVPSLGSDE